ncbi:hypothetical protein BH11CYA1_BH11CYA1_14850 [soil metagenome]
MRDSAAPSVKELMNELFDPKSSHKDGLGENAVNEALGLLKKAATKSNSDDSLDALFGKGHDSVSNPFKHNDKDFFRCASIVDGSKIGSNIADKGHDKGIFACAYFIKPGDKQGNEVFACAHKVQLGKNNRTDFFACAYKIDKKELANLVDKDLNKLKNFEK